MQLLASINPLDVIDTIERGVDAARAITWLRLDLLMRLALAAVLGGLIGLERETRGKAAGFRTNLLICIGAALVAELSIGMSKLADGVTADPARIAAQAISAIGFLGAGVIMRARGRVTGITTAATIWVVVGIGLAVGAGLYVAAIGSTVFVLAALIALGKIEERIHEKPSAKLITVRFKAARNDLGWVEGYMATYGIKKPTLLKVDFEPEGQIDEIQIGVMTATYRVLAGDSTLRKVIRGFIECDEVLSVGSE